MIECNQIAQVALELKMKFEACKVLEAEDLDKLVELVEAVNICANTGNTTINASQVSYDNSTSGNTNTNVQDVLDEILTLTFDQNNVVRVIDLGTASNINDNEKTNEVLSRFNNLSASERTVADNEIILLKIDFNLDS